MAIRNRWKRGDHLKQDARTGFTIYGSDAVREWTGQYVHRNEYEPRHPLDFVRGKGDHQAVYDARPLPATYPGIGPLTTTVSTDGATGATIITVVSTTGMSAGDTVRVVTDAGAHQTTISSLGGTATGGLEITLAAPLPGNVDTSYLVSDTTAATLATGGL